MGRPLLYAETVIGGWSALMPAPVALIELYA